ncbi:MAG: PRD domain-containing protein [Turicibacter sp.]|nr:PRD domain-containing protein [Turicibacter sp.]
MHLTRKKVQIIRLLLSSPTFVSSYALEQHTGIHHRIIREEIKQIRKWLKPLEISIISKASKGYSISSASPHSLEALEQEIEQFEKNYRKKTPNLPVEREFYIIHRLLTTRDFIKIDTLAEELFTSRSSISNTLKLVRKTLQKSNLVINQKPNYGLKIYGEEVDCRKPLVDVYFATFTERSAFYDLLKYEETHNPIIESVIIQIIEDHNISISDISICDLLLCISASVLRMRLGFYLKEVDDISDIKDSIEFAAAKEIANTLEVHLDVAIPEEEISQLGIELISKRASANATHYQYERASYLTKAALEKINDTACIDLRGHQVLFEELTDYIQGVLLRQRFNTKLRSPLFRDVKQKHPLSYALADMISEVFVKEKHYPLSLSELSYFTIILNTTLQRNLLTKRNVLLISGLSPATTQLIMWQINYRFGNEIIISDATQYHRLRHLDLNEYDFIVSTLPIHTTLQIPTLHINPIIEDDDFNKISKYLAQNFPHQNLSLYSNPNLFATQLRLSEKAEILPAFYTLLKENLILQDDSVKNTLNKSQGISVHEYDHLVTVIRYNRPINNNSTIATIINQQPIQGDEKPAQIFIFIAFKSTDEHLATAMTNTFIQLSRQEVLVQTLLAMPTYQNFIQILESITEN